MSPAAYQSFLELALGFCLAGALASGYQAVMLRPPSFRLLGTGRGRTTVLAMPFLIFAAPFIIVRNVTRNAKRPQGIGRERFAFAMMATVVAGIWSLMSGSLVVIGLRTLGILTA